MKLICSLYMVLLSLPAVAIPAQGHRLMAAGPSPYMIEAVQDIGHSGGNVIDAAVTSLLTLAVTSPYFGSIGGGGFAMLKMGDAVEALDFRETAPAATNPEFFVKRGENDSITGGAAVGVPGVPAGLWALHKKYGKLPWSRLFKVPLRLATQGFQLSGEWVYDTTKEKSRFNSGGKIYFLKAKGEDYKPGEILKQPALAKALMALRDQGPKGFYQGAIARDIVESVKKTGGVISLNDLKNYQVRWLKPLEADYSGYHFYLMPPPSSGGVVLKTALYLADKTGVKNQQPLSVDELHLLGEILAKSFRGRALLGDPDFHKNPFDQLLSASYLEELQKSIKLARVSTLAPLQEATLEKEKAQTTNFSIMDSDGHAIAITTTLNGTYGSGVVTDQFGIALNNEMDDFTTKPGIPNLYGLIQGTGNVVQPGKRPLSSMSPTLVTKDGKVIMAVGAPGGPRIISTVFQTLYRSLINGFDLDEAVQAPRVHHQFLPNELVVEKNRLSPEILQALEKRGHKVNPSWMGKAYAVRLRPDGILEGAFDARGEGAAGGY